MIQEKVHLNKFAHKSDAPINVQFFDEVQDIVAKMYDIQPYQVILVDNEKVGITSKLGELFAIVGTYTKI